ncbi:hypothetical protein Tco_0686424 [Tanacetum coccineum]
MFSLGMMGGSACADVGGCESIFPISAFPNDLKPQASPYAFVGLAERGDLSFKEMEYCTRSVLHHHHPHRIVHGCEMTCLDGEKMKKRRNGVPCHDHFEVVELF